mmetsp:Transcript_127017/g.353738  ORF Transcript_127017/g.353738 Transcript_127017/m.353738 type:complete len:258 (+) Transcript_127017:138-911(+)
MHKSRRESSSYACTCTKACHLSLLRNSVDDAALVDGEDGLALGEARRVVDLADAVLPLALAEVEPGLACVADDVPADGLDLWTHVGCRSTVWRCHDLVRDDDRHAVLVRYALQLPQEAVQGLLPVGQLAPPHVVRAEEACGAVHHEQGIARLAEDRRGLSQEPVLVLCVVRAGVGHILQNVRVVEAVALRDVNQPLRPEGALRVDVQCLALGTSPVHGQLAGDAECVAELRLATPELAEDLCDLPRLNATAKEGIKR